MQTVFTYIYKSRLDVLRLQTASFCRIGHSFHPNPNTRPPSSAGQPEGMAATLLLFQTATLAVRHISLHLPKNHPIVSIHARKAV